MADEKPDNLPGKMMNIKIPNKPELFRCYMSFLKHGGLFARTDEHIEMGTEVLLIADLPEFNEPKYLRTHVAWINPVDSASGQPKGVGLAFGDEPVCIETKQAIEDLLPGLLLTDRPTYTL